MLWSKVSIRYPQNLLFYLSLSVSLCYESGIHLVCFVDCSPVIIPGIGFIRTVVYFLGMVVILLNLAVAVYPETLKICCYVLLILMKTYFCDNRSLLGVQRLWYWLLEMISFSVHSDIISPLVKTFGLIFIRVWEIESKIYT